MVIAGDFSDNCENLLLMNTLSTYLQTLFFFIFISILGVQTTNAQVSIYSFSQNVGVYTPVIGGTVLGTTANNTQRFVDPSLTVGGTLDTGPGFPIGFDFAYNGVLFDRIGIHTKGWVSLGTTANGVDMASTSIATPLSSSAFISPNYLRSRIAGAGSNLQGQTGSDLRIETTGTAPNRVCVVQWTNYRVGLQSGMNLNFQIRLNEANHTIQVVYGTMTFNSTTNTADVGLGGFTSFDFNNRRTISPHNWNNTSAGITNTSRCTMVNSATPPTSGRTFTWTPAGCQIPYAFSITEYGATTATINFSCANCGNTFIIEYGPSDFTPGSGANPGIGGTVIVVSGTSGVITGLSPLTFYDVYVRQVCGTNYSLNSNPLSFFTRPPNDDVCDAIALNLGLNGTYTNQNATAQSGEQFPPPLGCNVQNGWCPENNIENSIWFVFTPSASGYYAFDCYGFDVQAALYDAVSCSEILNGSAFQVAANDNGSSTQSLGALISPVCLAEGITYYLQTDGYSGATGNLSIQVSYLGLPPPATLTCPENQTGTALFSDCEAFVEIPLPIIVGECAYYNFSNDYTLLQSASAVYPVGTTTVTYSLIESQTPTTCSFTVTVIDPLPSTVQCKDISVELSESGNAVILPADVFDFSESCFNPVSLISVFPEQFTCADLGINTVTLTAQDAMGNTADCNAFISVTDPHPPFASCQNITVNLNSEGVASILPEQLNNNSSDNCGISQFGLSANNFSCIHLGQNSVVLTVTDGAGFSSSCQSVVTVSDLIAPVATCQNISVFLDDTGTASITAAQINNGSSDNCQISLTSASPNVFTCIDLGISTSVLTVSDIAGNSSSCQSVVTVGFQNPPQPVCQNLGVVLDNTGSVSISTAQVFNGSTDVCLTVVPVSVSPENFTCNNLGTNTVTLTAVDAVGNTSSCQAIITVSDNLAPTANCQDLTVSVDISGNATITAAQINDLSADNCQVSSLTIAPNSFSCSDLGQNTVVLTVTDFSGNSSTCSSQVTVADILPPSAFCQDVSVNLDLSGNASITPLQINNGSLDNCGVSGFSVFPENFTCANIGNNIVTLTVSDVSGNTATCQTNVLVVFTAQPDELCQNISVFLNQAGTISISPTEVFIGNTDDCGGISPLAVVPNIFSCSDIGVNLVSLTMTDVQNNTFSCQAEVLVADNLPPIAECQNLTVNLNSSGNAGITPSQINNNSTDNCLISQLNVTPETFTCTNLGQNTVVLTATDSSGHTAACNATVTVADIIPPTALCQNISIDLDLTGNATITAGQINNGSVDNCGIFDSAVNPNTFTCADIGNNTVTLTVTDVSGNTQSCTANVIVVFNAQPDELCQNIAVQLSGSGNASISPNDVFIGNNDECGGISPVSVLPNSFNCTQLGQNTVTLTVSNIIGNTSSCQASVIVQDLIAPVADCQNLNVELNPAGSAVISAAQINNNSSDNCAVGNLSLFPNSFSCGQLGSNTVVLTVSDVSGNTSTCSAVVNVSDNLPPIAGCQNISVFLDNFGSASITATQVNNVSIDNCQISSLNVSPTVFGCAQVGSNTATLTVTDTSGNTATCQSVVQVIFNPPPSNWCQNISVSLNESGSASILPNQIFTGGSDACGAISALSVTPNSFNCSNIGQNTVFLTTTNVVGQTSNCQASVIVSDFIAPAVLCPANIMVGNDLNNCGATLIIPIPSSSDNCNMVSLTNNITGTSNAGGFYNTGLTTVYYLATDNNGNTASCSFTVLVNDIQPPAVNCPANVSVNAIGCSQSINWLPPVVSDNCSVSTVNPNIPSGSVFNVGVSTITYSVSDVWGNTNSCSFTVTLSDITPPNITCPNNISQNTSINNCTATVSWTSPVPSDNCSSSSVSNLTHSPGSTFNAGITTVVYTATDTWGNTASCSFTVTVTDVQPPALECPEDRTVSTSPTTCNAAILIGLPVTSDNCSSVTLTNNFTNAPDASSIYPLGNTVVTYSATDIVGNQSTCSFNVTVIDTHAPTIQCPANITQSLTGTNCFAIVIVPPASALDNCSASTLTNSLTGTANASGAYLLGPTTVVFTATDQVGNSSTCSFTVLVQDITAPFLPACPSNISTTVPSGICTATATWNTPFANDNCSPLTVTPSIPSGSTFNTGTTTVIYTAADSWGNSSTCSFTVTVVDNQPPTITCPPNMTSCSNYPTWPLPQYSDACVVSALTANKTQGAYMAPGLNTVTYTVTDGSGNTATCSFSINVAPPISIILSTSNYGLHNVSCNGGSNGIITALVGFGGVAPFSYLWSNGSTSNLLNNLTAGTYSVTVTDAIGCSGQNIVTLTQPPPIICSMTTTPASCLGMATGAASVSVSGGGAFLTYHWSGPNGAMGGVTNSQNNLLPGVYQVTATTTSGCTCITSGTVGALSSTSSLTGSMTTTSGGFPPFVFNVSNISFSGGSIPYTFAWITAGYVQYSSGSTGVSVIYTDASYWSVTISDNNPCTEGTLIFSNAPDVNTGVLSIINVTTNGDTGNSNGSISLTVVGGNPCPTGNAYNFSWAGPTNWLPAGSTNSPNISGLPSGWYILTVNDCGPDGIPNSGDEQVSYGYYWIPKAIRGRGKIPENAVMEIFPNPVADLNTLAFVLPETELVQVWLYDLTGRRIACLFEGQANGFEPQSIKFGKEIFASSGIYFCRLETASGYTEQKRVVVIK